MRLLRRNPGAPDEPGVTISPEDWAGRIDAERIRRARRLWAIRHRPDGSPRMKAEIARLQQAEIVRCKRWPFHWMRNYVWLENPDAPDPKDRVIPLLLWPSQMRLIAFLLKGYRQGRKLRINKARKLGASWCSLTLIYWLWWSEDRFTAHLGSRKELLVDGPTSGSLFGKIRALHGRLPTWMRPEVDDTKLRFGNRSNGSVITGEATNTGFGRGDRTAVVLTDEWAHVDASKQQAIKLSIESVSHSWWKISTPNGRGNEFHTDFTQAPEEDKLSLDWSSDPRRTLDWFEGLLIENGGSLTWDEREQEYSCSFKGVSGERVWRIDRERVEYSTEQLRVAQGLLPWLGTMDFGSGPSWTVLLVLLIDWDADGSDLPMIWVDAERVWERRAADEIGSDIVDLLAEYSDYGWVVGDPAGRNKESNQQSWESNLQHAGVPIECLPAEYNAEPMMSETIREVQRMLDAGRLRVHGERCKILLTSIESWEWDIPKGIPLTLVNRDQLKPKKNVWSHPGNALQYGVGAALRSAGSTDEGREMQDAIEKLPKMPGSELAGIYSQILGGQNR